MLCSRNDKNTLRVQRKKNIELLMFKYMYVFAAILMENLCLLIYAKLFFQKRQFDTTTYYLSSEHKCMNAIWTMIECELILNFMHMNGSALLISKHVHPITASKW